MRILITGGAGCLGSNLIERHLPRGHAICVIDNFATGRRELMPAHENFRAVEGSVADAALVDRVFDEFAPTHVIHSAASYKDPSDWVQDVQTNVLGAIHVAQAARRHAVVRVVNYQTALCYGRTRHVPISIDHPTAPFTSYGISKTAGEASLLNSGLPVTSLRLANICGPRLSIGPIPTFYKRLKAGQSCFCSDTVRDFLDMEDFLVLMDRVLLPQAPAGVYNVSTGEGRSIHDVFCAVAAHLGIDPPDVPIVPPGVDDVQSVVLDPSETTRAFGWRARFGFEGQLRWYDRHGVGSIYSHLMQPRDDA